MPMTGDLSDLLAFVDESGDHGLKSVSTQFPLLTIAMVIVNRETYESLVVPAFQALKREFLRRQAHCVARA